MAATMRFHTAYPSTSPFSAATSVRAQTPRLWDAYNNLFKDAKYIDLTHAFEPVQAIWPGFGNAKFKAARAGAKIEGYVDVGQEYTYEQYGFVACASSNLGPAD